MFANFSIEFVKTFLHFHSNALISSKLWIIQLINISLQIILKYTQFGFFYLNYNFLQTSLFLHQGLEQIIVN